MKKSIVCVVLLALLALAVPAMAEAEYNNDIPRSLFDYDAIIADPDEYKGWAYNLVCDVARIDDFESDTFDWEKPAFGLMSVDGDVGKPIYAAFDNPDDMIQVGDTVKITAAFVGVTDMQTTLGFYVKMPMFYTYRIEKMPTE